MRAAARAGQRGQLTQRVGQLREEIIGYEAQIASKISQAVWITKELAGVNDLWMLPAA